MSSGQLDQEQPSNKPVRALAFGLPRTTLLMGLMFVAGIVWGIHAGRQYRPLVPEALDVAKVQYVESGGMEMMSEAKKNNDWEKKNSMVVDSLGLDRQYRSGWGLGNPFATWIPIGAPVPKPVDPANPATPATPAGPNDPTASIEDAPKLDDLKLQGTLEGRNSTAIVNGRRCRVGDMLNGWKIVKIGRGFIVLDWKGNKHTLYRNMDMSSGS